MAMGKVRPERDGLTPELSEYWMNLCEPECLKPLRRYEVLARSKPSFKEFADSIEALAPESSGLGGGIDRPESKAHT